MYDESKHILTHEAKAIIGEPENRWQRIKPRPLGKLGNGKTYYDREQILEIKKELEYRKQIRVQGWERDGGIPGRNIKV